MKKIILYFALLLPVLANAQVGGNGVFQFLNLTNSARVASLGGNNISIYDDDLNLAFHNPALLNDSMNNKLVLNYVSYFADVSFGYASYANSYKNWGTFALGIHYVNYGDFIAANEMGIITGTFSAADYSFNIMWSKDITDKISGGISMIPIYSHLETYTSLGLAFNAGVTYHTKDDFSASFLLKNMGAQLKPYYEGHTENLPFDIQMGVSKKLAHAPFRVNLTAHHLHKWDLRYDVPNSTSNNIFNEEEDEPKIDITGILDNSMRHLIFGLEFLPLKSFYTAFSFNYMRHQELKIYEKAGMVGFSWGFGLKLKKFGISFGRSSYHLAGGSNHFSFNLNLNNMGQKKVKKVN